MRIEIIAALLVSMCTLLGWVYVLQAKRQRVHREKLAARIMGQFGDSGAAIEAGPPLSTRLMGFLSSIGGMFKPKKDKEQLALKHKLATAGYRGVNAVAIYCGFKTGFVVLGLVLGSVIHVLHYREAKMQVVLLVYVAAAAICLYLPDIWVSRKTVFRKTEVQHSLPDALDLMVVCVEAGMGLDQTIQRVGVELAEAYPALGEELRLLALELRAGQARREALKSLAKRIDLDDVNSLVALLIQSDKFGTSIAQTFRVYSDVLRTTRRQKAEEMAAKLPIKLIIPLILFIFPPLMIVILAPAAIKIIEAFGL